VVNITPRPRFAPGKRTAVCLCRGSNPGRPSVVRHCTDWAEYKNIFVNSTYSKKKCSSVKDKHLRGAWQKSGRSVAGRTPADHKGYATVSHSVCMLSKWLRVTIHSSFIQAHECGQRQREWRNNEIISQRLLNILYLVWSLRLELGMRLLTTQDHSWFGKYKCVTWTELVSPHRGQPWAWVVFWEQGSLFKPQSRPNLGFGIR
jgi:hypothetical protein